MEARVGQTISHYRILESSAAEGRVSFIKLRTLSFHRCPQADFTNTTIDVVFEGTLRQGQTVQLEQSPFLSLIPEQCIQQTLRVGPHF